ncbi:MAG: hypothetical protein OHK0039_34740 [Bacteroidia bacterium]
MHPISSYLRIAGVCLLTLVSLAACKKEDVGNPPAIEYVRVVAKDSSITASFPRNVIAIIGRDLEATTKVFVNDYETYFNPTLVTATAIIVTIPADAPWRNAANRIRVETPFGTAETPFTVIQPAPVIRDFDPKAAGPGSIVTIYGEVFDNLAAVRFGDVEAEVVSSSSTEIQVKVPEGVAQAFLFVETPGGIAQSVNAFGFALLLYGDAFPSGFWEGHWGGTADVNSTEVYRGTQSMKYAYSDAWGGFQIGADSPLSLAGYTAIKISIYGGAGSAGKNVAIVVSDNWGASFIAPVAEGVWSDFTIPLSSVGSPAALSTFIIQAQDFAPGTTIFIDDMGFI